jgi:hypothetical protein
MIRVVDEPEEQQAQFQINIPEQELGGSYANFLAVWHTAHEFTLDFAVTQPVEPIDPNDESAGIRVPCHVVSRVKIPPSVVFDVLRALNQNMTHYEDTFGPIKPPNPQRGEE